MLPVFEQLVPYFKTWLRAFVPGAIFAYLSSKLIHAEFATEIIFYDLVILFVIGKILLQFGSLIIDILTDVFSIGPILQPENFKRLQYLFGSACGIFVALIICWLCNCISIHFFDKETRDYYSLLAIVLGFIASIVSFIAKATKR